MEATVPQKKRREWPLAVVFTWRFAAVTLIPILVLSVVFIFYFAPRIKQEVEERQASFVTSVVSQTENYFASATRELGTLSRLLGGGELDDHLGDLFDAYASGSDFYEAIYLADARGRVVVIGLPQAVRSLRANHLGLDISGRDFFKQSRGSKHAVWSNSFLSLVSGRLTVAVAVPVGELTLVGEIATAPLPALVRKLTEHTRVQLMLLDRGDHLVAHSSEEFANQQLNFAALPIVLASRTKDERGSMAFEFQGQEMVGVARLVPGPGWLAVVAEPRHTAYEQINSFWLRIAVGFGIALLAALAAAVLAARLLARLFEPYNRQAQAIADGHYALAHIDSGTVELNHIGDNLHRMAQAIQERELAMQQAQASLRELNFSLEDRVTSRTDEMTRALQAAEAANRAKSVFLANMSHELRTPLNAVLGFSQLLQRDSEIGPDSRKKLATINRAGQHLLSLINDVLEISRIEAGRSVSQRDPFDLTDLLLSIEEMIRVRSDSKGLTFHVEHAADLPAFVDGDGPHLKQVLINLLGNAVKYTEQGSISLRVGRRNGDICFEVSDTGPGIASADQERIFQAFYQTQVGVAKGDGTGLGLAISQQYTQLMGGRLTVASQTGGGCVFTLCLPLPQTNVPVVVGTLGHVMGLEPGWDDLRVLVVDDKADNRELAKQLLDAAGFAVQTADNGQQAVEVFQRWQPRFIWMDMRMPVLDGYAATRRIRRLPGGDTVKIVALTASAFEEDRAAILAAGCDDMVRKPLEQERLFAVMGELLGVRYRRAEVSAVAVQASTEPDLSVLLTGVRQQLKVAAEALDLDAVKQLVDEICVLHPALAGGLSSLVEQFRLERIAQLCSSADALVGSVPDRHQDLPGAA